MSLEQTCPECGAAWLPGETCQEYFHQMLFWESEVPAFGEVHHLAVLGFYLQHPSLYSPAGLRAGRQLLRDFLEAGLSPQEVRRKIGEAVSSSQRTWKIKGQPGEQGGYARRVEWTRTARDVVLAGRERYPDSVRAWVGAIYKDLSDVPE